ALCVVGGVLLLGAWQEGQASPSPTPQPTPEVTEAPPLGLHTDGYSCGGVAYVPDASAGAAPAGESASAADGGPWTAVQGIASRLPSILPASGWRPANSAAGRIVYVAPNDTTPAPYAFVEVTGAGSSWAVTGYGDCEPAVPPAVASSVLEPIPWKVAGAVDATGVTLKLSFQANLCNETFVGQTVWYGANGVTITLWARKGPADEGAPCATVVETASYTLTLAEPLGNRQLQTGPASAARPADGAPTLAPTASPRSGTS
ncbi:MAG: hypothetical protein ABSB75_08630, partial [Candidatus Limnocylindrales bacterium]